MKILVSNDDGYQAPGILALVSELQNMGEITVVAPDRDRSGASNSLTLDRPLRVRKSADRHFAVNGTPTDCVHLAITGLFDEAFDMVVSGINAGANMGDDVIYSGTVAAAMEGRFMGRSAIAVSINSFAPRHFDTAARLVRQIIEQGDYASLPANVILNVNVPDVPWDELKGVEFTRLGHRHLAEAVVRQLDPRGRECYWIGPAGPEQDAGPGTDFHAVASGFASVTPLHVDLTRHDVLERMRSWGLHAGRA